MCTLVVLYMCIYAHTQSPRVSELPDLCCLFSLQDLFPALCCLPNKAGCPGVGPACQLSCRRGSPACPARAEAGSCGCAWVAVASLARGCFSSGGSCGGCVSGVVWEEIMCRISLSNSSSSLPKILRFYSMV